MSGPYNTERKLAAALEPLSEDLELAIMGGGPPLHPALSADALRHCIQSGRALGACTPWWPELSIHCVPLRIGTSTLGALGVLLPDRPTEEDILEVHAVADMLAGAIQRERNASAALEASAQAESQALRNTLLTAISHDFRTPLATIIGASSDKGVSSAQ